MNIKTFKFLEKEFLVPLVKSALFCTLNKDSFFNIIIPKPILNQTYGFKHEDAQHRLLNEHSRDSQNSFVLLKMVNGIRIFIEDIYIYNETLFANKEVFLKKDPINNYSFEVILSMKNINKDIVIFICAF